MYTPNLEEFLKRSEEGNLVPVYREVLADLETPVSAFLKLGGRPHSFLLESVAGGEQISRYSFIGGDPFLVLKTKGRNVELTRDGRTERRELAEGEDPLHVLKGLMAEFHCVKDPELPPFCGGAVGYIGYDTVRFFERLPDLKPDDRGLPDCYFVFTDTLLIFDHVKHRIKVLCLARVGDNPEAAYADAKAKIDRLVDQLRQPLRHPEVGGAARRAGLINQLAAEATDETQSSAATAADPDEDHPVQSAVIRLAHAIVQQALLAEATEIRLEHNRSSAVASAKVGAELREILRLPRRLYDNLAMRYKVMAGLTFTEGRYPKDKRIPVSHMGQDYDLFLSVEPTTGGERITIRIEELPPDEEPTGSPLALPALASDELQVRSIPSREEHAAAVLKGKEYIAAGDIIQVVVSRRMEVEVSSSPFQIYRALRSINPSPYMFLLQFEDCQLIGASPEILVTERDKHVVTRPIAGTVRRGKTLAEDKELEAQLLADPKERAEHIMLVDLHRNDIGRVCEYGSVQVDQLMVTEKYSHVIHIVSNVVGELRPDKDAYDLIRATFPAGTLSGAPKIRAMEIIEELEPVKRGPYGGCIGYFSFTGDMDTAITLRTIVMKGQTAYVQAGGGIVADSDPEAEYQETVNKAGALMRAIEFAERGLE